MEGVHQYPPAPPVSNRSDLRFSGSAPRYWWNLRHQCSPVSECSTSIGPGILGHFPSGHPGTTTSANITLTKDRDFGITECLCSPEDDKQAGLYAVREVLDADGKNVMIPVVGDRSIKKVEVNVIPQRLIDNKAAREAAEEAESQSAGDLRHFADLLATRGPLNRAKAVEALREAAGITKRRAEEAVTASRKDPRFSVEKEKSVSGSPLMFRLA